MSHAHAVDDAIQPNAKRLLWAGFFAILAAGVGFGIRGGILDNWGVEFGFSATQLGAITGAGFTGFCFGIIIGGIIADRIGYGKLVIAAFLFHVLSAVVTFAPSANFETLTNYRLLYWGTFIFAIANGTLEAVANPLVATLFPHNRTHYLNILHASWPAGLVLGGACGWILDDKFEWPWKWQLALFLVPTLFYGVIFLGQAMPRSEASKKGLTVSEMFSDVGVLGGLVVCGLLALFFANALGLSGGVAYAVSGGLLLVLMLVIHSHGGRGEVIIPMGAMLLFVLFFTHAMVGAVELGTDGWIQNITGNLLSSQEGKILFVWTSLVMFTLRFCANFIERRIGLSPVGILLVCSILACVGLNLSSGVSSFRMALLALTVYGIGKTFFWPTMLAVASDRFPKTGAIAISIMGGIGMMSAGLVGSPGLGYCKDRFSAEALASADPQAYEQYKAGQPSSFLGFEKVSGLDPKKLGDIENRLKIARDIIEKGKLKPLNEARLAKLPAEQQSVLRQQHAAKAAIEAKLRELGALKEGGSDDIEAQFKIITPEEKMVHEASIAGDRRTLRADSFIPAAMAVIYLLILLYFKATGGYRPVTIETEGK